MSEHGNKRRIDIVDKRASADDGAAANTAGTEAPVESEGLATMQGAPEGSARQSISPDAATTQGSAESTATDEHGIEFWQEQAKENIELAMRKQAELENYRRQVSKDMDNTRRFAVERLLSDLFPVLDGLAQAVRTYKDTPDNENPLVDGLRRTLRALDTALAKHGISKIGEAQVAFDSELHQPLTIDESPDVSEEIVAEVYVEGYRLGDTVLKPAMVRVLKPSAE